MSPKKALTNCSQDHHPLIQFCSSPLARYKLALLGFNLSLAVCKGSKDLLQIADVLFQSLVATSSM